MAYIAFGHRRIDGYAYEALIQIFRAPAEASLISQPLIIGMGVDRYVVDLHAKAAQGIRHVGQRGGEPDARGHLHETGHAPALAAQLAVHRGHHLGTS